MLGAIARAAHRADVWLQARLGRPYNAILGIGLTVEIVRRAAELPHRLGEASRLAEIVVLTAMNGALLIHQLGQLSHRLPATRRRRGRPDASPAPDGDGAAGQDPPTPQV